jgi:hypothetical protein
MVPSPVQTPNFFFCPEQLLRCSRQPVDQHYPIPVSELFRHKAFWFRGLGQKPGQRFAVCGWNLSHKQDARARSGRPVPPIRSSYTTSRYLVKELLIEKRH